MGSLDPDQPESSKAGSVEQSAPTASSLIAAVCGICMEPKLSATSPHNRCSGTFCDCCLRQHIRTQVSGKKWPISCPAVDCGVLSMADCCKVVFDKSQLQKVRQYVNQRYCCVVVPRLLQIVLIV